MVKAASTADNGLYVDTAAMHYGVSAPLATPFDPADGLVLQYEVTTQDGLDCGGAYLKFLTADAAFTPEAGGSRLHIHKPPPLRFLKPAARPSRFQQLDTVSQARLSSPADDV